MLTLTLTLAAMATTYAALEIGQFIGRVIIRHAEATSRE